ncbi:hypothetical protein KL929_003926 [Ogataea haglerorum]|nr:hypothetical protein KL929_003926 [Ogataea haglerorum]
MFGASKGHDWIHTTILVDEVDIRLGDFLCFTATTYISEDLNHASRENSWPPLAKSSTGAGFAEVVDCDPQFHTNGLCPHYCRDLRTTSSWDVALSAVTRPLH